jgi:hypothetical protein
VADEDRLVELQVIKQADEIAGQMLDVVVLDRLRVPASLIALIWWRQEKAISGQPWQSTIGGTSVFGPAS